MRIQSINSPKNMNTVGFQNIGIVNSRVCSSRLRDVVKTQKEFEKFSEVLKNNFPELNLRCIVSAQNYNAEKCKTNSSLVLYTSDARNILRPNINILKKYEADNQEELAEIVASDKIDLKTFLEKTFAHYRKK